MVALVVFYLHIVAASAAYTRRWQDDGVKEGILAVVFFAAPDVLSGLFTLANYDVADPHGVVTPMGSGCASIINYPYEEAQSEQPRCVLGMFDVSARPGVPGDRLTFAVPIKRFEQMVLNMDESFLITDTWRTVERRLARRAGMSDAD